MIRRWLALTYYLYALRLAALSHFYFNPLYKKTRQNTRVSPKAACILLRNRAVQSAGCFWASGNLIGKLFF